MGTQVPPESDTTQTTELDNPPSPAPAIPPDVISAYNTRILEQQREINRLRAEEDRRTQEQRAREEEVTEDEEKEFFAKPVTTVRKLIRREMETQVKPINDFTNNLTRQNVINGIKQQMRNVPAQFPYIEQVESIFDQLIQNEPNISPQTVVYHYNAAVGTYIANGGSLAAKVADAPNDNPPPSRRPVVNNNPPHARPSAPPAPSSTGAKKKRQLTEAEKKIARYNNMTDDEYILYTDELDPKEVATLTDDELKARMK